MKKGKVESMHFPTVGMKNWIEPSCSFAQMAQDEIDDGQAPHRTIAWESPFETDNFAFL